jgi:phospholipase/carboxylesterase
MTYQYAEVAAPIGAPLLFLLHGTGGDENDLLDLGRQLMPDAHLISPRGDVLEGGAPRFFKRLGMGIYDMADLARATAKLAGFIRERAEAAQAQSVAALGYSNGANILASVLFEAPELIDRAVLMHPLIPFLPPKQAKLAGRHVLITAGRQDPIAPASTTQALANYFAAQGAIASVAWHEGGHEIRRPELAAAEEFLVAGNGLEPVSR